MKLEKRSNPGEGADKPAEKDKKPVIVYIMVMFIAAFLLMTLSFFSHQRSNTEVLGRLQSSVSAMQEVQDLQEQVIDLQKELAESKEAAETFQNAASGANDALNLAQYNLERTQEAMEWFWQLDEQYLQGNLEMCRTILEKMNQNSESPMTDYLTPLTLERYQEIKTAVEEPDSES